MKQKNFKNRNPLFHRITLLVLCTALALCVSCNPSGDKTPSADNTPSTEPQGIAEKSDYLVIPLTSGNTSPISAMSYDLLNTVVTIQLYDTADYDILNECFALIDRYERIFSKTKEGSEVYNINHSTETSFTVSDELRELLALSLSYCALSDGAFDVTVAPLTSLWDFTNLEHKTSAPANEAIRSALALVDYNDIQLNGNTLSLAKPGMQLEFGAIAKGYIADKVKEFLLLKGVRSGIINLGGNVLLVGEKPDGSAFNTGIQKPFEDRDSVLVAITELRDVSMVSSGIYERYFYDEDGKFYHHILDPKTGYPINNNLLQVTIISPTSAMGDALSTSCFALGVEKGMELVHSLPDVYAVFITSDGKLHFSDGYLENLPTRTE
ncbi:MAG: FAD:protein FMN transferase [Lachnospiraceae bacterium]|nr:FAD:protein FMN transferase [Lachnospiraceae bacterium]